MPDWCHNALDVWADDDGPNLQEFVGAVSHESEPLQLGSLYPTPEHVATGSDVVQWRHLHWGTKWEVDDVSIEHVARGVRYWFASAWAGPTYWCEFASALYPELHFRLTYVAPDEQRASRMVFFQGVLVDADEVIGADMPLPHFHERALSLLRAGHAEDLMDVLRGPDLV